jgi:membrane protein YqaA with SNARE-associated domain
VALAGGEAAARAWAETAPPRRAALAAPSLRPGRFFPGARAWTAGGRRSILGAEIPATEEQPMARAEPAPPQAAIPVVRHFRQILLWPLQLVPVVAGDQIQRHWEYLQRSQDHPWREVADEFTGDPAQFEERHYAEFVTFLPHVQRFLYGEGVGAGPGSGYGESPIRVFRRRDVVRVRILSRYSAEAVTLQVAHVDLYFFYDLDVIILAVEVFADGLDLTRVQDTLFRFGRAYPPYWNDDGSGAHCLRRVEWLAADGAVLAASDYERREKYLAFVCRHRAPCIASHWEYLLQPLVLHHSDVQGPLRYRQIEYHRLPLMGFLSLDDPHALTRAQFIRLGLVTAPGDADALPYAQSHLADFEARYCYDRYWEEGESDTETRFLCCGPALLMVGNHNEALFEDPETGLLSQFRHQYFLLFLIAHVHKAALLMLSDRLVVALTRLDIHDAESVKQFKRTIRQTLEIFLRFTHRYWFHEISDQVQIRGLFRMTAAHLDTDRLYAEVREEIEDMSDYLESDTLRRQANTVVRLTVVTVFGLIATTTTGFLGMNLIAAADSPLSARLAYFALVFVPTAALTIYTVAKSKRLSDFLEALSDERLAARAKLGALAEVWRRKPPRHR